MAADETTPAQKPLQGVVVPVDNRDSYERVQDTCFEGLLRDYTAQEDWAMVEMIGVLWDRIQSDRIKAKAEAADAIPTTVQIEAAIDADNPLGDL